MELVVGGVEAGAAGEEEKELGGGVGVVGGFGDVDVDAVELGYFLFMG